jgi:hypothetical protein
MTNNIISNIKTEFIKNYFIKYNEYKNTNEVIIKESIINKVLYIIMYKLHLNGYTFISCDDNKIEFKIYNSDKEYYVNVNIKSKLRSEKLKYILNDNI